MTHSNRSNDRLSSRPVRAAGVRGRQPADHDITALAVPAGSAPLHELSFERQTLVLRVRREIAEGRYDSDDKLEVALERMFSTMGCD